jgi:hypothetical protein
VGSAPLVPLPAGVNRVRRTAFDARDARFDITVSQLAA